MPRILLVDGDNVRELDKVRFAEESKLQDYLEQYPSLIPLSEIAEGASDLVCIGREVGVPSGAIDLLYVDRDGLLTIVETKLVKNPQIRREVIGQIVEYASFVSQWNAERVFELANDYRGSALDEMMTESLGRDDFADGDLRSSIEQKLKNGRIRLVIAVDELNEALRSTVTFLNSHSTFDMLLLQVSDFQESQTKKVLIPSLFGYKKPVTPPSPGWTEGRFMADVKERCGERGLDAAVKLYEFTTNNADKISWGKGAAYGSFAFQKRLGGVPTSVFVVYSDGTISIQFGLLKIRGTRTQVLEHLREGMNRMPGVEFGDDVIADRYRYPSVPLSTLAVTENLDAFTRAVLLLCQELESD